MTMPPQRRAEGDLAICGYYEVEWTLKGPTHGWRCGVPRMLESQNASDVCTAKSQG